MITYREAASKAIKAFRKKKEKGEIDDGYQFKFITGRPFTAFFTTYSKRQLLRKIMRCLPPEYKEVKKQTSYFIRSDMVMNHYKGYQSVYWPNIVT